MRFLLSIATTLSFLSAWLLASLPLEASALRLGALEPPIVKRIDRAAERHPFESVKHESVNFGGNVIAWLLSRVILSPQQERAFADDLHKSLLEEHERVGMPKHVDALWKRLVKRLPQFMKPKPFRYHLTLLDIDEPRLMALGAGRVCITTGLLARFTDSPRDVQALGFLLAREIGHIGYEHCQRGWQLHSLQQEVRKKAIPFFTMPKKKRFLETGIHTSGKLLYFLFSREQEYQADLFAWQLCRNAGFPSEGTLDGMRFLVAVRYPQLLTDKNFQPRKEPRPSVLHYYLSTEPNPLARLKRLLMERDGRVPNPKTFGLFRYDRAREQLVRCAKRDIPKGQRAVVLVHGLRGTIKSMDEHLEFLVEQAAMNDRELLVFRYPSNESLARCGKFLNNEMKRVVADANDVDFVAYSAGGLIFRYYTEVEKGTFGKAVLLGTPHRGSSLTELKFFLDMAYFVKDAKLGLLSALAKTLPEGRGAVAHDLHPDSLFLRQLGSNKRLAGRYHIIYGEYFGSLRRFAIRTAMGLAKKHLQKHVDRIDSPFVRRQTKDLLSNLVIPREVLYGDLVVSRESARLPGAGRITPTRLHHIDLKKDEFVQKAILKTLTE